MGTGTEGPVLEMEGVVKRYEGFTLGPIGMQAAPGMVTAFVGPNGAGKTTTFNCVVGLCRADAGTIRVCGRENRPEETEWKHEIGYVGEIGGFYLGWTARRNLGFLASFYPRWDRGMCEELARRLDLDLDKPVGALSRGNRAKLAVVAALSHRPRLLLLDEPFNGLDPVVRTEMIDVLWECLEGGESTILYSTHILSDVERLADEIALIMDGRLVLQSEKDRLVDSWRRISFTAGGPLEGVPSAFNLQADGGHNRLTSWAYEESLRFLREKGAREIEAARMSLEEITVEIMRGHSHVDARGR